MNGEATLSAGSLHLLETRLATAAAPVVEHLRPGLDEAEMSRLLDPLGFTAGDLHPDLRAWWSWHDGSARMLPNGSEQPQAMISSWLHLPLRHAVEATALKREVCSPHEMYSREPAPWTEHRGPVMWTEGLIGVFTDVGGQVAAADTARDDSALFYARIDDHLLATPLVASMGALVEHWCTVLEQPVGSSYRYSAWPGGPRTTAPSFPDEPEGWTT